MLQLPAANRHSFDVILDCLNRVASYSSKESIEADELAEDMAPYLLWRLAKPPVRKVDQCSFARFEMIIPSCCRISNPLGISPECL